MNGQLEYIDNYFKGELTEEEALLFDRKISEDPEFASEVSFYISSVHALRQELTDEKKRRFRNLEYSTKRTNQHWVKYLAAAAVIAGVAIGIYLFNAPSSPDLVAQKYINTHLSTLGIKMANTTDTVQKGIGLYNEGKIDEAHSYFESFVKSHPTDSKALEYAGIVSLRLENFDKALQHFEALSQMTHLYANPGNFYVSLTLLKRNRPGDVQRATTLLQQIVKDGGAKQDAARELLEQL